MKIERAHLTIPPARGRRPLGVLPLARGQDGFMMVEIVVAMFIFAMVMTGVIFGMTDSLDLTRTNRLRSVAANLAAQEMDTVRSTPFTSLPLGLVTSSQTVDSIAYTITRETAWVNTNATSGPCQAPSGSTLAYLSVRVNVTWANMSGVKPVVSNTVVTPPVGTYDANSGHIAVTVRNAAGQPQSGIPVALAGPGVNASQLTTADGCAFFAYEPPASYTVTLNKAGDVDGQRNATPSQSATVQIGSIVSLQFQYDVASTLSLTLQGSGGAPLPASPGVPVALFNTHLLPSGVVAVAGTGASRTIGSLFPYTDGYQPWAGSCSDADPQGVKPTGGAYYPGATRPAPITVTPGATSTGTVALPAITVATQTLAGAARANVSVTATHVVPAGVSVDPACTSGEIYTLGTTNASGLITVALPYGTWRISAAGTSTTADQTLSPLISTTPTVTLQW
jgi:type II secretory pathway pseudopilin PulG